MGSRRVERFSKEQPLSSFGLMPNPTTQLVERNRLDGESIPEGAAAPVALATVTIGTNER